MSYVNSIGGNPVNPNPFTYSTLSISTSISLGWAINGQQPQYPATDRIDVTASVGSLVITMPDATEAGIGTDVLFYNYGANTITINDFGGSSITTVAAGMSKLINLVTNSTSAGTWRSINIGAGTSTADASALAGYGLVALAGQLSQAYPPLSYSTDQTIGAGQRAYLVEWTGGAGTFTLTDSTVLGSGWFFNVYNTGSGILALTPTSGTINGSASLNVALGEGFTVICDGVNFFTIGKVADSSSGLTLLTKSVAGGTDVTLTTTEANYGILYFTGLLSANINVIVPTSVREWVVYNNTTGAFTLTVKTSAGTGIAVTQGTRQILIGDGTNVVKANDSGLGTVTSVATGTGLTGGTITTAGTITLANTAVVAGTYGGSNRVNTFVVDAQGRLTSATQGDVALLSTNNLSDVGNAATALANLGGGSFPVVDSTAIVKGSVDATKLLRIEVDGNTTGTTRVWTAPDFDLTVPPTASPTFTGTPAAPTAAVRTNTTQIATTAYVQGEKYVYQNASVVTSSLATGTTILPLDNTIPQITEGDQYMTLSFTPISAANTLLIWVNAMAANSGGGHLCMALFQDAVANALAATAQITGGADTAVGLTLVHKMVAGTTSAITFRVRIGSSIAGTTSFNGVSGAQVFGGVANSSIVIQEVR